MSEIWEHVPPHDGAASLLFEQLRIATALGHTIPGVVLDLECATTERLLVAYGRLDAQLTPCQLRCALICERTPGKPQLADAVTGIEVLAGLDHLGGGLYGRGGGAVGTQRWLASTLPHTRVGELVGEAPATPPLTQYAVQLTSDPELAVTVVRIEAAPGELVTPAQLDEVAWWVLSTCLVAELDESRQHDRGHV